MCTVTIATPSQDANAPQTRIFLNRDVSRLREPAAAPEHRVYEGVRVLMPVDVPSDGTWVAVNESGVLITLLNRTLPGGVVTLPDMKSRGLIIPAVIHYPTARHAANVAIQSIDPRMYPTFRLILCDDEDVIELRSDGDQLHEIKSHLCDGPFIYGSSGLGDHYVSRRRYDLFTQMVETDNALLHAGSDRSVSGNEAFQDITPSGGDGRVLNTMTVQLQTQRRFHAHAWSGHERYSVNMAREDARTVSYTEVERWADRIVMRYHADAPNNTATDYEATLDRITST